jgi:1-pyrroline-5-carboxylate dehydrogenase
MANAQFQAPLPVNEPIKAYGKASPEKTELKAELQRQKAATLEIPLIINGEAVAGNHERLDVVIPHNHKHVLAHCQQATAADLDHAVKNSLAVQKDWAHLGWEDRAAIFLKAADLLAAKYRPILNAATMLGQSKTAFQAEIDAACELIDFFRFNVHFMEKLYAEQPYSPPGMWNRTEARGLEGFVLAITPFNFTSIAINLPAAPALMGCTVLWKPATTSVLSSYLGMELLKEAGLPAGVINFIPGDPQLVGGTLLKHPDLAGVHFTGSTKVFNHIWQTVGTNIDRYKTYPRLVGETGGKDFIFAHPTADAAALAVAMVRGSFEFQGQKCSASSRAYIPKSLWKEVKERLAAIIGEIKQGDPEDFTNFMSAVIDATAFKKIKGYIDHAKSAVDARVIIGGESDDSVGYYIRPTVIETSNPRYRSMVEEIFGPVLTVYVYDDARLDETLALCDQASPYALTGAIFARDRHAIHHLSKVLVNTAGNFYINDKPTGAVVGQQPFGGARASGTNDKAGSMLNLTRWMSMRTIKETFVPPLDFRYPHMAER